MFKTANCILFHSQMDYLCELPNDAARRKALQSLPKGLFPTYERILERINQGAQEVQTLAQRTLRWIAHGLDIEASELCEAVAIDCETQNRDEEAIPEQTAILRSCSSLIRLSEDQKRFQFAHFTVAEFLQGIEAANGSELAAYCMSEEDCNYCAKACLIYLNYGEFQQDTFSKDVALSRFKRYPFRRYAVTHLSNLFEALDFDDEELFDLATNFFLFSKSTNLMSWACDFFVDANGINEGSEIF